MLSSCASGQSQSLVDESGAHFETAGSLKAGRQVFITMKVPNTMMIGGWDAVDLYLVALNSHDGGSAFRLLVSPVRVAASVATCAEFWGAERVMLRRLYLCWVDEPDVTERLRRREAWRTDQFRDILAPLISAGGASEVVGAIVALTGFATYDQLVTQTGTQVAAEDALQTAVAAVALSYDR